MKKICSLIILVSILLFLSSCDSFKTGGNSIIPTTAGPATVNTISHTGGEYVHQIRYAEEIDEYYRYHDMSLFDDCNEIPLYNCKTNFSNTWNGEAPMRMNNAVGIIELSGTVKLHLNTTFNINDSISIKPLSKNIQYEFGDRYVDFIIEDAGDYTIEFHTQRTLHLFVYDIEEENQNNTIYFSPGIHNKDNSEYINSNGEINVKSNTNYHLALGAIVEARFLASNKENVTITGHGVIAGAKFDRSVERGTTFIPFDFNYVNNLKIDGIVCLDPAGWCYNIYFCRNVRLQNIKLISSRSNGDGISIQSCEDVYVEKAFVRSWDDSLVVKNYPRWNDKNIEGKTKNINFKDSIIWTDLAQSMEIGYETIGNVMEDIHFENIIVLHNFHKAVISIHNGNNAHIKNVTYKNIICEDAKMGKGDGENILIDIRNLYSTTWSSSHKTTPLGYISDISIDEFYVYNANNPKIVISGTRDNRGFDNYIHSVDNVEIKNLVVNGNPVTKEYNNLFINYVNNLSFK